MPWVRLYRQHPPNRARSFLDGYRTQPQAVELIPRKTPGEAEAFAVVVHHQNEPTVILRQFYHDMGSLRMLFYVVECFSVNLEDLAAHPVRCVHSAEFTSKSRAIPDSLRNRSPNPFIRSTMSADCTRSGRRSVTMCRNSPPSFFTVCWSDARPDSTCSG